jgi:hypothetical protein
MSREVERFESYAGIWAAREEIEECSDCHIASGSSSQRKNH